MSIYKMVVSENGQTTDVLYACSALCQSEVLYTLLQVDSSHLAEGGDTGTYVDDSYSVSHGISYGDETNHDQYCDNVLCRIFLWSGIETLEEMSA